MTRRVALCVDEVSSCNPELIGLEGELLDAQEWCDVFSSGTEARQGVSELGAFSEAWVISCEDIDPINLAAAIKSDRPDMRVCLFSAETCGSLLSRAHNAQIDEVFEQGKLPLLYADAKRLCREESAASAETVSIQVEEADLAPAQASDQSMVVSRPSRFIQLQSRPRPLKASAASRAFIMPVVSGSGGAGKSSVAALGALIAQRMGHRTLLLDYDLQFGDVDSMLGIENPLRIDVALAHPDQLARELARNDRVAVLAAPARLESAEEAVRGMPVLLEELAGEFDVIIANTGAAWAEQHAVLLERSSAALFLVDQRASSVRACKHALELCARCGIATGPFQFALNRCAKGAPLTSVDVSCALQGVPVFELREGGRDVEGYLSGGAADELIGAKNDFAKSIEHVLEHLLPRDALQSVEPEEIESERRPSRRRGRHAGRKRGWR